MGFGLYYCCGGFVALCLELLVYLGFVCFLVWLCLRGFAVCGGFARLFVAFCCFGFSL